MGLVLGRRGRPGAPGARLTMGPAHEPFDRFIAAAWVIYGSPDEPSGPARRLSFRLGMLAGTLILLAVILRERALPEPWHRIGYALWLVGATVLMRGEKALGDRRLSVAAALGLTAAIGFVAWLALLAGQGS